MNDIELLELTAKAIGARPYVDRAWPGLCLSDDPECGPFSVNEDGNAARTWNPLDDDGDALRLAVKLRISPILRLIGCDATDSGKGMAYEKYGHDDLAATRRAIVRAAAEIGRSIQVAPQDPGD